jgi:hypothetical protein
VPSSTQKVALSKAIARASRSSPRANAATRDVDHDSMADDADSDSGESVVSACLACLRCGVRVCVMLSPTYPYIHHVRGGANGAAVLAR